MDAPLISSMQCLFRPFGRLLSCVRIGISNALVITSSSEGQERRVMVPAPPRATSAVSAAILTSATRPR